MTTKTDTELLQLLKPITIHDKPLFDKYFSTFPSKTSELTFANIFCWSEIKHTLFCEYNNHLFLSFRGEDGIWGIFPPIGPNPLALMFQNLFGVEDYYWARINEDIANKINGPHKPTLDMTTSDYVYKIEDLVNLAGSDYHGKRNFVKRFEKLGPKLRPLTFADAPDCIHVQKQWLETQKENVSAIEESTAFIKAATYKQTFPMHSVGVFIKNNLVAFAIGEPLNKTTFVEHYEKALPHYPGAYQFLLHKFAKSIPKQYTFLNREEDLGIPGLRKAKKSWHPAFIQKKYILKLHKNVKDYL